MIRDIHVGKQLREYLEDILLIIIVELLTSLRKSVEERIEDTLSYNIEVYLEE